MTVLPWVPTTATVGATIPANNRYYITMFGGGRDAQCVACPSPGAPRAPASAVARTVNGRMPFCSSTRSAYADGTWWYLAGKRYGSLGRWPCGTKVRISDPVSGKSCVAEVADIGPHSDVERQANGAVVDVSPLVTQYLFGRESFGWSDRKEVEAVAVPPETPVGPAGEYSPAGSGGSVLLPVVGVLLAVFAVWQWKR